MATGNLQDAINYARKNPQTDFAKSLKVRIQSGQADSEAQGLGIDLSWAGRPAAPAPAAPTPPGVSERIGADIHGAGEQVQKAIQGQGEFAGQSPIRRGVEATATAFATPLKVATEVLPQGARDLIGKAGQAYEGVINWLGDKLGGTKAAQDFVTKHPDAAKALEEAAGTGKAAGDIASTILTENAGAKGLQKGADVTKDVAAKGVDLAKEGVQKVVPATKALIERSKDIVKPEPSPAKAMGEVMQGSKPLAKRDVKAFRNIDTEGVTTYADLKGKIDKSIGDLSEQVDTHLAKDPAPVPMDQLVTNTTTGSGEVVSRNFVSTALEHLKELYDKTADDVGVADIKTLAKKASEQGLTRTEVNDISRLYNSEFGSKAFSKLGDPLTSVNAQAYENIRKGLKEVARRGMGGTEAEATDKIISSLYNVKDLVTKNAQAVQKLQQKIAERGLLEKAGHALAKYGDLLTGGSIRGFIGGLLPRGAGYKVMNAIDLEARLEKNLEIIKKALQSGSDDEILNATKSLTPEPSP